MVGIVVADSNNSDSSFPVVAGEEEEAATEFDAVAFGVCEWRERDRLIFLFCSLILFPPLFKSQLIDSMVGETLQNCSLLLVECE